MSDTHQVESVMLQDGEQEIRAQSCTLGSTEDQECLIYCDCEERDEISTAIVGGTYTFPPEYYILPELAVAGLRVLDLGAHIGTFSLFAAASGYQVVSVEASPRNAALLRHSAYKNGFTAQRVISAAVSDHVGVLEFVQAGPYGLVSNPSVGDHPTIVVPAITVDRLLDDVGWDSVDFVKMDVEGSEVAALRGMSRLLSREDAPPILYESNAHTLSLFGETPASLMALLEEYGYHCYLVEWNRLVRWRADELQAEVCVDYLATKRPLEALGAWSILPSLASEDRIVKILSSSIHPNVHARVHLARVLSQADAGMLADPRVVNALAVLKTDTDPVVRTAMAWWQEGEAGHTPTGASQRVDEGNTEAVAASTRAHWRYRAILEWDLSRARHSHRRSRSVRSAIELGRRVLRAVWARLEPWMKRA